MLSIKTTLILILVIGGGGWVWHTYSSLQTTTARLETVQTQLDVSIADGQAKDTAIQQYADEWQKEQELNAVLNESMRQAGEGLKKTQEDIVNHDFKKIHQRHPDIYLRLRNNRAQRLRDEARAALNPGGSTENAAEAAGSGSNP